MPYGYRSVEAYNAHMRKWRADRVVQLREDAFSLLGGAVCVGCGTNDRRVLVFDHIEGGGNVDRYRKSGNKSQRSSLQMLERVVRAPKRFRVLCHNCNILAYRYGLNGEPPQSELRPSAAVPQTQMTLI